MTSGGNLLIKEIGGYDQCVAVVEKEVNIPKLLKISRVIDAEFGVTPMCSADELVREAVKVDSRTLSALSGYSHLLIAERMHEQGFDNRAINREIEKAEAMLSHANLGGGSTWLPRAQKLKRIVNWRSYAGLGLGIVALVALVIAAGLGYRFIVDTGLEIL